MSFVERRSEETRRYLFYFFIALGACIALITVVIAQLSWRGWVQGLRALLRGEGILRPTRSTTAPGAAPDRPRPPRADPRPRAAVPAARRQPAHLGPAGAARDVAQRAARQRRDRRVEPRAVHPRAHAGGNTHPAPGQRPRHRARAGDARVLGNLDRPRQRQRRSRDRRSPRPRGGAARAPALPGPAHLADRRGGTRLLQRLRQRRPVAAVPHRARAAHVPLRRLRALPQRQREVRRRGRRRGEDEGSGRAGAGLSFCAAAADDPRAPARRDDHHVLAHSLAQSRGVRDLPVAHSSCWTACSAAASWAFTRSSTATISSTPSTACSKRASTASRSPSPSAASRPPCIATRSRSSGRPRRSPRRRACPTRDARCASAWGCRGSTDSASASTASTTPRASSSGSTRWSACSSWSRAGSAASRSSRSPRRREPRSTTIATTRRACSSLAAEINARYAHGEVPADRAARRASRAGRRLRVPARRRRVLRHQPARRDEPGRQGVRRGARRRAGRADPVAVRRGIARTARGARGQSLRCRPVRGCVAVRV